MTLSPDQERQVDSQLQRHLHPRYTFDLDVDDAVLHGFVVERAVYRSDQMITRDLAKYLLTHREHYSGLRVLDMGCGSGHLGILMAATGAAQVVLSDVCPVAVDNAQLNVTEFGLDDRCEVVTGHLFDEARDAFDLIVFNHPFFPAEPPTHRPASRAMLDKGALLLEFLERAPQYLRPASGAILMPYLKLAGATNDPGIQAPSAGYFVEILHEFHATHSFQPGPACIYRLVPKPASAPTDER